MGAWGTTLYSNETPDDIARDYVDLLRGNSERGITED